MTDEYRPGQVCPQSGIWVDRDGTEIALSRGDRFPPTSIGGTWQLREATEQPARDPADG